ncbi:MAG: indole-3-glycerol phosphate synthase TrpC [Gemmatimonadota bacterium]|nr:indole-3-glycerol phosphate synthase TrpC [Gemmatimonadota bacterium]
MAERNPKVNGEFLARTLERKRAEVDRLRTDTPESELRAAVAGLAPTRPWADALGGATVGVIAEVKRRSPSAGALAGGVDPAQRARLYQSSGAAAVSVLTDSAFDGALEDLRVARARVSIPVLRKDFLVDPWQVWESRAAGADAVLVIVAAVDDAALYAIAAAAREAGLGLLVEVHDPEELERAAGVAPAVLGVNARDLSTLAVSTETARSTLHEARRLLGRPVVLVAESGIRGRDDVLAAAEAGADAVLVGEHLMRSTDPAQALAELTEVPVANAARDDSSSYI